MSAYRDRTDKKRITGYPALIFQEIQNYNRPGQDETEKFTILMKWYSHLDAYLPVYFLGKLSTEEQETKKYLIEELLPNANEIKNHLVLFSWQNGDHQDPDGKDLSDHEIYNKKIFLRISLFELLDKITAISGVINDMELSEDPDEVA